MYSLGSHTVEAIQKMLVLLEKKMWVQNLLKIKESYSGSVSYSKGERENCCLWIFFLNLYSEYLKYLSSIKSR